MSCSNEDTQPPCIAPPSCGEITPNQVNFAIFNNSGKDVLGYEIIKSVSNFESIRLSPIPTDELGCWHSFSREGVTAIKVTLNGDGNTQEDLILDLSNTIDVVNDNTYWVQVSGGDNGRMLSITPYDPTACNDTDDN